MFLKILFWLLALSYSLLYIISSLEVKWKIVDWLGVAALALGFIAFYGLAYKKHIWSKRKWALITITISVYWALYTFYLDYKFGAYPPEKSDDYASTLLGGLPILGAAIIYTLKLKR